MFPDEPLAIKNDKYKKKTRNAPAYQTPEKITAIALWYPNEWYTG